MTELATEYVFFEYSSCFYRFERSEAFLLLRLMGVLVPSLHIESTDSMISHYGFYLYNGTLQCGLPEKRTL